MKNVEVFSQGDYKRSAYDRPYKIQYLLHHPKKHLTLIKIEKDSTSESVCMPEGEHVGPYHQCVSVELNDYNSESYVNSEVISATRSACNTFRSSFEQQTRQFGSLPEVLCTGNVNYDSRQVRPGLGTSTNVSPL